jgi:hypothetical protein
MAAEERQWQYLTPAGDKRVRAVVYLVSLALLCGCSFDLDRDPLSPGLAYIPP